MTESSELQSALPIKCLPIPGENWISSWCVLCQ